MFTLSFETDNAAFEDYPREEIARILQEVSKKVQDGTDEGLIRDLNGNRVGRFDYKP